MQPGLRVPELLGEHRAPSVGTGAELGLLVIEELVVPPAVARCRTQAGPRGPAAGGELLLTPLTPLVPHGPFKPLQVSPQPIQKSAEVVHLGAAIFPIRLLLLGGAGT